VETVVPLVTEPYKNFYDMSQGQLDEFLAGYDDFDEFIVSIQLVDEDEE
jgi:hypothetical protein